MLEDLERGKNAEERVSEVLAEKLKLPLITEAIEILKTQIPPSIKFHTVDHTLDVLHEAILFAVEDGLSDYEIDLVAVAAAHHDIGYVITTRNNEPIGAKIAADAMVKHGYTQESIKAVQQMIFDTAVQVTERGLEQLTDDRLASCLLDADLSNFGRPDFMEKRELIFHDLGLKDWGEYLQESLQFLENHRWKTPAGQRLREEQRIKNLEFLKQIVATIT
jgi:uncharacterized protein